MTKAPDSDHLLVERHQALAVGKADLEVDLGVLGLGGVEQGGQGGVDAHPVVLAVAADKGPVQADEAGRTGRHGLEFGAVEIGLGDAVLGV